MYRLSPSIRVIPYHELKSKVSKTLFSTFLATYRPQEKMNLEEKIILEKRIALEELL